MFFTSYTALVSFCNDAHHSFSWKNQRCVLYIPCSWTPPRATCQRHVSLWALFNSDATRRPLRWCPPPPSLGGGAIVKTLEVVTETGTVDCWSARMELWGGAEVAWMWCCAAPLVFGLLATLFFSFFPFFFNLPLRWRGCKKESWRRKAWSAGSKTTPWITGTSPNSQRL